jgi:hypothetical protein
MRFEENPEWRAALDEMSKTTLGEALVAVHDIAQRVVPVDTGYLESRLYVSQAVDGKSGVVGDDADYARWVEEGHRVAYKAADGTIHYTGNVVAPQPYLRVGLNSAKLG